jgi:hypothetical protein
MVLITLQSSFVRGYWITSIEICYRVAPIVKKRGNLFAIPLKKLKVKIKIQEATDSLKN